MGVGGQRHAPAALLPGETRYPLYRRLSGSQDRSGLMRIISPPTGIRFPDRPACSESLYRLSYPGPFRIGNTIYSEKRKIENVIYSIFNPKLVNSTLERRLWKPWIHV